MISGCSNPARLAALFLLATLSPSPAAAQSRLVDEYVAAVQLARAEQTEQALTRLVELVRRNPDSVPLHRALALVASKTDKAGYWERVFRDRKTRTPRDRSAMVGLAVLRARRGAPAEGHRLLRIAVEAGERDPCLARLLVETTSGQDGLLEWLAKQSQTHPRDPLLFSIHAQVLIALNQVQAARTIIELALSRGQEHPDLLALHASILRAAGEEKAACQAAALAAAVLDTDPEFPEFRVPRRTGLARVLTACGRLEPARRLLSSVGPQATLPGDAPLRPLVRAAEAELALARGDLVEALYQLGEGDTSAPESWETAEIFRAVRASAQASLGIKITDRPELLSSSLPEGLALADRAVALAAVVLKEPVPEPDLALVLSRLSEKLQSQGLRARASRAEILRGFLLANSDRKGSLEAIQHGLILAPPSEMAAVAAAAGLVRIRLAAKEGPEAMLSASSLEPRQLAGAPGALLAAIHVRAAQAALKAGEPGRAALTARQGFLDLQEADRSGVRPPQEYWALAGDLSDLAIELAGLAFRAGLAEKHPLEETAGKFLQDLGRAARSWSQIEVPWPDTLESLIAGVPKKACLVVAAIGESAPALVVNKQGKVGVTSPSEACLNPACDGVKSIYWAGPAAPPGGLSCRPGDGRALVRLVSPSPLRQSLPEPVPSTPGPAPLIGPGSDRPLKRLVETLSGFSPVTEMMEPSSRWPLFAGAGLASSHNPLSSGWLVPPEIQGGPGWLGPESIPLLSPVRGPGLIATGLRILPGRGEPEKGNWVLAEAALQAGWRFALLSREPLGAEELALLRGRVDHWRANPVNEARRTAKKQADLAARLTLWTLPGKLESRSSAGGAWRWVAAIATLALGALLAGRLFSRRRSAARLSRHRAQHAHPR